MAAHEVNTASLIDQEHCKINIYFLANVYLVPQYIQQKITSSPKEHESACFLYFLGAVPGWVV